MNYWKKVLICLLLFILSGCGKKMTTVEIEAKDLNGNDLIEKYVFWEK